MGIAFRATVSVDAAFLTAVHVREDGARERVSSQAFATREKTECALDVSGK